MLSDQQRWLIRSGARNVRSQFEDQVRRTLGGQRQDNGDVWDVATTETPPESGEAPECQWCPICRAARRMRDSRPGLAGQLTGAGDTVAAAVQEAARAFDTFLTRAAGGGAAGGGAAGGGAAGGSAAGTSTGGSSPGRGETERSSEGSEGPVEPVAGSAATEPEGDLPKPADPSRPVAAARPDSLAGEHGPVGWKPGDRLATAGAATADPWATATAPDEPADGQPAGGGTAGSGNTDGETDGTRSSGDSTTEGPDGRGHGPSNRG
jgi:hypothetical protein